MPIVFYKIQLALLCNLVFRTQQTMINKSFLFSFFLFIGVFVCGQTHLNLDSLLKVLPTQKNDTDNKAKTLIRITREYNTIDFKKTYQFATLTLKLSQELKWDKGMAWAYFYLAFSSYNQGNFATALNYRLKELTLWQKLQYEENVCTTLGNIGVCYSDLGDNVKALKYYIFSLEMAEKLNMTNQEISSLTNIATIYDGQKNFEKALEYYFKSLKLAERYNYEENAAINLGNIGNVYSDQGNYSKAITFYLKALKIDKHLDNKNLISSVYANIGAVYQHQSDSATTKGNTTLVGEKSHQALDYYFKALKYTEALGNEYLQAYALGNIGEIYVTLKQFKEAEEYLNKSFEIATKINSIEVITDAHHRFHDLYKKLNQSDKALQHYEKYIALRDSISNEDNKKIISELQVKFESEKKEVENKTLVQENKLQTLQINNNRYLMGGLISLFILILGIGFLIIRQNKLKAKQLVVQFEQQLLRTQMNPHFIFNSLASIESFIYDHQPKEAGVYLSNFSRLMRLILENSALEYITLEKEIEFLNYYLSLQKLRLDDNLSYTIEVDKNIDPEQIYLPPMLTQPFIENAIEHGFRGSEKPGDIKVLFNLVFTNLQVQIIDNGIGIDKAQQQKDLHKKHKSMATQITMERLAFLNKSKKKKLSFTYTDMTDTQTGLSGTKIVFLIPL